MSLLMLKDGPYVNAMGWTQGAGHDPVAALGEQFNALSTPIEFIGEGKYALRRDAPPPRVTEIALPTMRASGIARSRSAAKATVLAGLLGKKLLESTASVGVVDGQQVAIAVASSSAITPIAWEFETVGLSRGWDKTDTMLLPSSIPSAITTQTSAAFDTHAAAIAFQDGAFGVCAAMEYAYLALRQGRAGHMLVMGAEEICQIQCDALTALADPRPRIDGAAGVMLGRSPLSPDDWRLALCGNVVTADCGDYPGQWEGATRLSVDLPGHATLYSSHLIIYALHHLFSRAAGQAVLECTLPGRGKYVLGFEQRPVI
jgi:hypothetical protein